MRKREEHEMNKLDSWMESYPKSWELTSVRGITENINQKNSDSKNTNYLSLMANVGVLLYADKGDVGNKLPDDLSKCKLVDIGDLVINSMNYGIGSYGISPYNGICSPVYLVLRSNKQVVLNEFAKRIFEIDKFQKHAQSFGTGILEHRRAINWDILKNISVALPDLPTQQRIASFLDAETSKIDNLVDELTKFKANLLLQKRSLVSECVTKGVPEDRNRAYKDSGVEWLGEIPVGWEISKLKRVASCHDNLRKPLNAEERGEIQGDYPYWGANSIQDYVNDYLVEGETILLGEDAAPFFDKIKSVAFYTEEKIWPNNHIHVLKAKPEIMAKYLTEALNIVDYSAYISGSIRDKLTQGAMMRILVPMPPLDEQVKIIQYIDSEVSKINSLISEIDNQIGLLKTYRKSLINEVVTGKVEV